MVDQKISLDLSWQQQLSHLFNKSELPRLAVVGVGQFMRGDDAAGPEVIQRLTHDLLLDERMLLIDAGHAPENIMGVIVRFRPDIVLFIDAARMGEIPGYVTLLDASDAEDTGGSTHTLSLTMLSTFIYGQTRAPAYILGIQPARVDFGEGISASVAEAVELVANAIAHYWRNAVAACSAIKTGEISVVNT